MYQHKRKSLMIQFTKKIAVILTGLVLIVVSCDHILKNKSEKQQVEEQIKEDKKEATLLVSTTQNTLNTISLCEMIEKSQSDEQIKETIKIIRKSQEQLLADFQQAATQNLVSVASRSNIAIDKKRDSLISNNTVAAVLNQIDQNIDSQIQVLDTLIDKGNKDLKRLAKAYKKVVVQDDVALEYALESLK